MESTLRPPADPGFRLIETGLWTPREGLHLAEYHLARLQGSAAHLGIAPVGVEQALGGVDADGPRRLRLTMDAAGRVEITLHEFTPEPAGTLWRLAVSETRLEADNPWLAVKSTERHVYDRARAELPERIDEVIFLNQRDEVCEGTITNVFADLGAGLVTPPLTCGVLPGVLRAQLIAANEAREVVLSLEDLRRARALYVGNALRGLIPAALA